MVDKKATEPVVESRYPREELIAQAEAIFGVKPEVVIGALHGNTALELSLSEVRAALEAFRKRRVK